jgi:hypothetical protein
MPEFTLNFQVPQCPISRCQKSHEYNFLVRSIPTVGGKSTNQLPKPQTQSWEVPVTCPETGETYIVTLAIPRPEKQKIVSVKPTIP